MHALDYCVSAPILTSARLAPALSAAVLVVGCIGPTSQSMREGLFSPVCLQLLTVRSSRSDERVQFVQEQWVQHQLKCNKPPTLRSTTAFACSFEVTVTTVSLPPFVSRRGPSNTNQRLSHNRSSGWRLRGSSRAAQVRELETRRVL